MRPNDYVNNNSPARNQHISSIDDAMMTPGPEI